MNNRTKRMYLTTILNELEEKNETFFFTLSNVDYAKEMERILELLGVQLIRQECELIIIKQ